MNIEILETTFNLIRPESKRFAHLFYNNLFFKYPETKSLFANISIAEQENKLMVSLVLIIDNLRDLTYLKKMLINLGERHLKYEVVSKHYQLVGEVLLATLEDYLKSHWTAEVKQAWTDAYEIIVDLMLEGAKEKYYHLGSGSKNVKCTLNKLKFEAIVRKAWRDSGSSDSIDLIVPILTKSSYFQATYEKLGQEKTLELVSQIIEEVINKELN